MRIDRIDVLRGAALFGILVVNIMVFAYSNYGSGSPVHQQGFVSTALAWLVSAVFELKFYLLFSFLFGYSLTLQRLSAVRTSAPLWPRMLRRNAALLIIGMAHAVVLFHGDILTSYALLGTLLLLFANVPVRRQIALAITLVAATALLWAALAWMQWQAPPRDDTSLLLSRAAQAHTQYTADAAAIIGQHLADLLDFLPLLLLLQFPCAFAMFLLGHAAGQRQLLSSPHMPARLRTPMQRAAVLLGIPSALLYASATHALPGSAWSTVSLALSIATAPFLAGGIILLILHLADDPGSAWLSRPMAAAGRMALTHYLVQSALCALVFHGYGLSLQDHVPMPMVLAIAVLIYTGQLAASVYWLRTHRYGPVEWLLRAATLAAWPQWRHATSSADHTGKEFQ